MQGSDSDSGFGARNLKSFGVSWTPLGSIWGHFGDLLGTFGGSGTHFEADSLKKGGGAFLPCRFWGRTVAGRPEQASKLRPRGRQEASKKAFERKTSKTLTMMTLFMNMLHFGGLQGSKNCKFRARSNLKSTKHTMRS